MKIHEIIAEASGNQSGGKVTLHDEHDAVIPNQEEYPNMFNNPYLQYRFGLALAGSPRPEHEVSAQGPGRNFVSVAYSKGDEEIIKAAQRIMKQPGISLSHGKSMEPPDIHTQSPIKPQPPIRRKNK